jgi:hypothetical protein
MLKWTVLREKRIMHNHWLRSQPLAAVLLAGAALLLPASLPRLAAAQDHPVMSDVVPDGGTGEVVGKITALDAGTRHVTVMPSSGTPITFVAGPHIRLDDLNVGDRASLQFRRTVVWLVTGHNAPDPEGATHTVGQVAQTPGGIGPDGLQLTGRILKVDGNRFDVVNVDGGGVYTIQVVDPQRQQLMSVLKANDAITVGVSPLTIEAIEKCGWFGCF